MIGVEDLNRLASEITSSRSQGEEWLAAKDISVDAMASLLSAAQRQFMSKIMEDADEPLDALIDIVGQTFLLGWETCEQYGVRS